MEIAVPEQHLLPMCFEMGDPHGHTWSSSALPVALVDPHPLVHEAIPLVKCLALFPESVRSWLYEEERLHKVVGNV